MLCYVMLWLMDIWTHGLRTNSGGNWEADISKMIDSVTCGKHSPRLAPIIAACFDLHQVKNHAYFVASVGLEASCKMILLQSKKNKIKTFQLAK